MSDDNTLDQGKKVNTPDQGKKVDSPDVSKLVADAVAAAMAPFGGTLETLAKTVNGLAADKRRGEEPKGDKKADANAKTPDPELATLREELANERKAREADRKRLALKEALDAYGDQIIGRKHLEKLIAPDLEIDTTGRVVANVDGKHVALNDYVKTYADDPQFRSPTRKDGAGKPAGSDGSNGQKKIQIKRNDLEAKAKHIQAIARGEVEFVD